MALRHAVSLIVLPGTVTILIPVWIVRSDPQAQASPWSWLRGAGFALGAVLLLAGLSLAAACVYQFARRGEGTLAPWDPPRRLVIHGPYRHVRNPMISGVILVLVSEALLLWSAPLAAWAAAFTLLNLIYIPLFEEPDLRARFGEDYTRYTRHVPRVVPRLRPWSPTEPGST
jgi:protein-S-isoprenylcysteine O-methyltransferase Ste14